MNYNNYSFYKILYQKYITHAIPLFKGIFIYAGAAIAVPLKFVIIDLSMTASVSMAFCMQALSKLACTSIHSVKLQLSKSPSFISALLSFAF
jgi:hypothetical protein